MDCILVSQPIRTLDRIVHMPPPIVLVHVSKRSIDTALGCDGMTSCREELRYTCSVEASLGKTKGCSKTSPTSADNNRIILMILQHALIIYISPERLGK